MLPAPPSLLITGATASTKGSAGFRSFAAGKFALRALSQSLAQEFGPKGVHVVHDIMDGVIDNPRFKELGVNSGVTGRSVHKRYVLPVIVKFAIDTSGHRLPKPTGSYMCGIAPHSLANSI